MDDAHNRPDIFGVRPMLAIDAEMLCWIFVSVWYRNIALATARLNNESAALARGFIQCMRPDSCHYGFIHWYVRLSGKKHGGWIAPKIKGRGIRLCQPGTKPLTAVTQAAAAHIQRRVSDRITLRIKIRRAVVGASIAAPVLPA